MAKLENLRNGIIDKILAISNKEYLTALDRLVNKSDVIDSHIKLTDEQIFMLQLSEKDITENRMVSQEELDRIDLEWLTEK